MRLVKLVKQSFLSLDSPVQAILRIEFSTNGVNTALVLSIPEDWETMTRAQKIDWAKQQITSHLTTNNYASSDEVVYPNAIDQEDAANAFEAMPGWATWSATEAEAWIEANVSNLATTKTTLKAMAKAIIYLRDNTIPK
jgi:hypothetical protein